MGSLCLSSVEVSLFYQAKFSFARSTYSCYQENSDIFIFYKVNLGLSSGKFEIYFDKVMWPLSGKFSVFYQMNLIFLSVIISVNNNKLLNYFY